jgi:hypothetical protein
VPDKIKSSTSTAVGLKLYQGKKRQLAATHLQINIQPFKIFFQSNIME